ncbi:TPA: hypothetical protein ACH3X2_005661 [Trebouxia sp. C0005]
MQHLKSLPHHDVITWDDFGSFMKRSYASLLPAREASQRYAKLKQTGSVKEFVREQMQVVRELDGTPYHPGGSVFDDSRNGLKPDVCKFVDDRAPTGWYTNMKELYQKALDYEGKRPREAEQGGGNKRHNGGRNHHQRGGGRGGPNGDGGGASGVHIPNDEFEARERHGVCTYCGHDGHYSNKCCNGKSMVPSFAGRN